jgi:RNA polymerase sigma-70 factor (ECF subfamily)
MPPLQALWTPNLPDREHDTDRDALDRRWLAASVEGDRSAFDALVEAHQASLLRFIRTLVREDAAAEDALQETFLAAYRGAAGFRGEGRVRGWLFAIARHCALKSHRIAVHVEARDETLEALGGEAGWGSDPHSDPERGAQAAERRESLRRALESLSVEDRTVISLHDLEELTGPETAEVLGLPLAAVKSRLHRARLRLMAALRAQGVGHAR